MTKAHRAVEWAKTLLIVLLTASAIFLGWRTKLLNDFFRTIPLFGSVAELMRGSSGNGTAGAGSIKEAARPLCIVITNEDGERYGVRYDTDARNAVYDRTSSIIGEALGSASASSEIGENEWRAALSGPGVYYEYTTPVRLSVLYGWLGARMPDITEDVSIRRVYIAFGEDKSRIYYLDHENGLFYGADTASSAGKAQELGIYTSNGSLFAYELGTEGSSQSPYMLIMPGREHPDIRTAITVNAEEILDVALRALGHSSEAYTTMSYEDGSVRRVGTQFIIRIDVRGGIIYRRTDIPPHDPDEILPGDGENIERARAIAAETIGKVCGAAEVFFEYVEPRGVDAVSVYFGYYIAGGSVYLPDNRYAARITLAGGVVTDVDLNYREFSYTGELTGLLPEQQALAAAGGEFMLCYSDTGAETLQPSWIRRN